MSDEGLRGFRSAECRKDWVVLHGGATAVFRVDSLSAAARLALAVTELPGVISSGAILTINGNSLTVRLTRDLWQIEPQHTTLALAISTVAQSLGALPDRSAVQEVQLAIAAKADAIDVGFWRAVLGYLPMAEDNAVDPLGHGSTVWMQQIDDNKTLRHAMHIDVSVAHDCITSRLDAALAAGGRIVDDSHAPAHWTLADRAGNRVCICAWPDGATEQPSTSPA